MDVLAAAAPTAKDVAAVHDDVWLVWQIVAGALVVLMTPAVAFFYGGMTRAKASLNMMMMVFGAFAVTAVVWVLWGYSETAGKGIGAIVGNPGEYFGLSSLLDDGHGAMVAVGFGATFAIITAALIAGAIADRAKFGAWMVFVPIWITLVYCPLAFMVWGDGGLMADGGWLARTFAPVIDYAGGTVVHINAGVAGLILALIIGKRVGFGTDPSQRPHNLPLVLIGASLLWFGWFGFNAGAATDSTQAGLIWVNTLACPAMALLAWITVEWLRDGKPTSLGAASGVVAGLVAITPACANVSVVGALVIGVLAGVGSAFAVGMKYRWGYDDSLDVVGVHLVSGVIGTVAIGLLALPAKGVAGGLFYGGGANQLVAQVLAALFSIVFTAVVTFIIGIAIHKTIGLRVAHRVEVEGIDIHAHAETAYDFGGVGTGASGGGGAAGVPRAAVVTQTFAEHEAARASVPE